MTERTRPIVYFDGGCPVCRREIGFYQRLDRDHAIDWRDIVAEPRALEGSGLSWESAMRRFHARDPEGRLRTGVDAFAMVWEHLPYWRYLAKTVRCLRLIRPLERLYAWYADRRFRRRCSDDVCGPD